MIKPVHILLPVLLAFAAGCATTSGPTYPVLEQTMESDRYLSCEAIAGDFYAASSLRAEILEAHGEAISDAITDSVWGAVTNPGGVLSKGVWTAAGLSKQTAEYAGAASAAGKRMEQLLRYKREKDCPETPSRDPSLTDDEILTLLDQLLAQYEAREIDEKTYLRQRASFLSKLHILNY